MLSNSWAAAAVAYLIVKDGDGSDMDKFLFVAAAYAKGRAKDRRKSNNFLDRSLNTGNFFQGIQRNSDIGNALDEFRKKTFGKISNWWQHFTGRNKFIHSQEMFMSNVASYYSRSEECKSMFGSKGCFLFSVVAIGYQNRERRYHKRRSNLFNKDGMFMAKSRFSNEKFVGYIWYNTERGSGACIQKDSSKVDNSNPSSKCKEM
jgi:hypothetical protein